MYLVWPSPCRRPSGRVARWPTADISVLGDVEHEVVPALVLRGSDACGSGACDLDLDEPAVRKAFATVAAEPKDVVILSGPSSQLPGRLDLRAMHQSVRWMHIDGEHTGNTVWGELEIAHQIVGPQGMVVIDDFFSPRYPANTTEVVRYMEKNPFHFRLFAVAFNKAYLCRPEALPRHMDFMAHGLSDALLGYDCKSTIWKTTGAWDTDAVGVTGFVDAAGTIARLIELGVPPYLVASTLVGVVAQRLVRTICLNCRGETALSDDQLATLGLPATPGERYPVWHGIGCSKCRDTGLKGRTGVYEVMPMTERIRQLILARADSVAISRQAAADGMLTLRESAIRKMALGLTSFAEVVRVTIEAD